MLQKELAKRLKARYDTKMDGNEWLEVSSDGIPLCRIKYNGQFLSNADQNLSDEYRSKIADIQDEISTVREYVGLYEHAPQMKAADVSDDLGAVGALHGSADCLDGAGALIDVNAGVLVGDLLVGHVCSSRCNGRNTPRSVV